MAFYDSAQVVCAFPSGQNLAFLRNKSNYSVDSNKLTECHYFSPLHKVHAKVFNRLLSLLQARKRNHHFKINHNSGDEKKAKPRVWCLTFLKVVRCSFGLRSWGDFYVGSNNCTCNVSWETRNPSRTSHDTLARIKSCVIADLTEQGHSVFCVIKVCKIQSYRSSKSCYFSQRQKSRLLVSAAGSHIRLYLRGAPLL